MTFTFQGHKFILKPLSPKEVHEDQLKMKTKRENEKEKERKDKLSRNISSSTTKSIMLTRAMLQIAPPRCPSLSFSLPKVSTYTPSLLKTVRNYFQTPPQGFHLLRGFSSKRFVIPKQSFQTWYVYRGPSFELPKLKEHKSSSHPIHCTILYVSPLTVLSARVLNSRSNSLKPGGHDASQANKKMTNDANDHSNYEKSSQHANKDLTRGRNGQRPEHLMFFLLVSLIISICLHKILLRFSQKKTVDLWKQPVDFV